MQRALEGYEPCMLGRGHPSPGPSDHRRSQCEPGDPGRGEVQKRGWTRTEMKRTQWSKLSKERGAYKESGEGVPQEGEKTHEWTVPVETKKESVYMLQCCQEIIETEGWKFPFRLGSTTRHSLSSWGCSPQTSTLLTEGMEWMPMSRGGTCTWG